MLSGLEDAAGFDCEETHLTVVFALEQVATSMIADELHAVAMAGFRVLFVLAQEREVGDNEVEADGWLVTTKF